MWRFTTFADNFTEPLTGGRGGDVIPIKNLGKFAWYDVITITDEIQCIICGGAYDSNGICFTCGHTYDPDTDPNAVLTENKYKYAEYYLDEIEDKINADHSYTPGSSTCFTALAHRRLICSADFEYKMPDGSVRKCLKGTLGPVVFGDMILDDVKNVFVDANTIIAQICSLDDYSNVTAPLWASSYPSHPPVILNSKILLCSGMLYGTPFRLGKGTIIRDSTFTAQNYLSMDRTFAMGFGNIENVKFADTGYGFLHFTSYPQCCSTANIGVGYDETCGSGLGYVGVNNPHIPVIGVRSPGVCVPPASDAHVYAAKFKILLSSKKIRVVAKYLGTDNANDILTKNRALAHFYRDATIVGMRMAIAEGKGSSCVLNNMGLLFPEYLSMAGSFTGLYAGYGIFFYDYSSFTSQATSARFNIATKVVNGGKTTELSGITFTSPTTPELGDIPKNREGSVFETAWSTNLDDSPVIDEIKVKCAQFGNHPVEYNISIYTRAKEKLIEMFGEPTANLAYWTARPLDNFASEDDLAAVHKKTPIW